MNHTKVTVWQDVEDLLCKIDKTEDELDRILPWFYEHVKCFDQVKEERVKEIIRKSEYAPVRKDHVIIRQGEIGDCCYILLRGTVTVYARRIEETDNTILDEPSSKTVVKSYKDRSKFGAEVTVLKSGDKFGDLCFYKSNNERNATVVADENLDVLVISEHVYQTQLFEMFSDLKDQLRFMETSRLFKGHPYDYRITLLEKMRAKRLNFGSKIVSQGDPVTSIFIICRGEALLKVNPAKLSRQYHLRGSDGTFGDCRPVSVIQRRRQILKHGYVAGENLLKKQNITVATLGPYEIIGDVEFVLNLASHHVTAVCNSSILILEMEITELHRLILKRDVGTTDFINASVFCKLDGRANRCANVPQYRCLHEMGLKAVRSKKPVSQSKPRSEGSRKSTLIRVANVVALGTKLGKLVKNDPKPATEERSGSIVGLMNKTATVALEIGGGTKITQKLLQAAKKQEGRVQNMGQDAVTAARIMKGMGKARKDVQGQEKGKKQLTAKEYRLLKKKMQAAGKTIRPLD